MTRRNIGYHTRLYHDSSKKICGGSFGGKFDEDTVDRLVRNLFDVVVRPSGRPIFIDKEGREVWLYITVDPENTTKGRAAMKKFREEQEARRREEEAQEEEIQSLLEDLTHEEAVRRLKGNV